MLVNITGFKQRIVLDVF